MHDIGLKSPPPPVPEPTSHQTFQLLRENLACMRSAILPRLGIAAALTKVQEALEADCLLFSAFTPSDHSVALHQSAPLPEGFQGELQKCGLMLEQHVIQFSSGVHHALLICEPIRSQAPFGLLCWKKTSWSADETDLLRTLLTVIATLQDAEGLHRNVLKGAHYDLSSNLLNWEGLKQEMERRIPRLDRDCLAATLMIAHVPGLSETTQTHGFQAGEEALTQCIALLRKAVRPTDAIARLSGNMFALWLDGGDRFAMAERAERMTAHGIPILINPPVHLPLHIGLMCREANDPENTADNLLERASQALQTGEEEQKKWRFSHEAP
ncbi:hypothetical protein DmGdi_04210 [Gluconobacter sp. Gdi]|nr:hypothetical protein DmGdi_04210 [Gluconobacter sp. Gdi]